MGWVIFGVKIKLREVWAYTEGGEGEYFSEYYITQLWCHKPMCKGKRIGASVVVN